MAFLRSFSTATWKCRPVTLCANLTIDSIVSYSKVALQLSPGSCSYFDEPVHMKVSGLPPDQPVELRSKLTDSKGITFEASAVYHSCENGQIDLDVCHSGGGSFVGIEAMGLFSLMKPLVPHRKLTIKDVSMPLSVDIEVKCRGQLLANQTLERRFMADGVQTFPLEGGKIRGSLFVPPGPGPFPAILDVPHLGAGLTEIRASLLANKGYVVMALAYQGYQDLPKVLENINLEYFEEAVAFLLAHPKVKGPGIGIISISKAGDLALAVSSFLPGITATVSINGCNSATVFPIHYKDRVFPTLGVDSDKIVFRKDGLLDIRDGLLDPTQEENRVSMIPIEHASCQFLFAAAEDDRNWNSVLFSEQAAQRLRDHGKENFELVRYPRAGHFLDVPYMPHCPSSFHPAVGTVVVLGGETKDHAEAQLDLWNRVQNFFRKHL